MEARQQWTKTKRNMIRLQDHIEAHLSEDITAKGVAEQLGLVYETARSEFQAFFGVGIGKYISDRRMERAALEIAGGSQVGTVLRKYRYATYSAFAKAFRKHFGISARECRKGVEPRRRSTAETLQELRRDPELYHQSCEYLELTFKAKHGVSPMEYVENKLKQKMADGSGRREKPVKHPENLTFEEYQFNPVYCMVRGLRHVDRRLVDIRDYIVEHIDEDITPKSVIEHFGLPFNHTRGNFSITMGESMSSMIRRLKQERTEKAAQEEASS